MMASYLSFKQLSEGGPSCQARHRAIQESFGIMVNYLYDHDSIENNHEAFVRDRTIVRSPDVDALLLPLPAGRLCTVRNKTESVGIETRTDRNLLQNIVLVSPHRAKPSAGERSDRIARCDPGEGPIRESGARG
jgi:hypothetical protein